MWSSTWQSSLWLWTTFTASASFTETSNRRSKQTHTHTFTSSHLKLRSRSISRFQSDASAAPHSAFLSFQHPARRGWTHQADRCASLSCVFCLLRLSLVSHPAFPVCVLRLRPQQGVDRPREQSLLLLRDSGVHGSRGGEQTGAHAQRRLVVLRCTDGEKMLPPAGCCQTRLSAFICISKEKLMWKCIQTGMELCETIKRFQILMWNLLSSSLRCWRERCRSKEKTGKRRWPWSLSESQQTQESLRRRRAEDKSRRRIQSRTLQSADLDTFQRVTFQNPHKYSEPCRLLLQLFFSPSSQSQVGNAAVSQFGSSESTQEPVQAQPWKQTRYHTRAQSMLGCYLENKAKVLCILNWKRIKLKGVLIIIF